MKASVRHETNNIASSALASAKPQRRFIMVAVIAIAAMAVVAVATAVPLTLAKTTQQDPHAAHLGQLQVFSPSVSQASMSPSASASAAAAVSFSPLLTATFSASVFPSVSSAASFSASPSASPSHSAKASSSRKPSTKPSISRSPIHHSPSPSSSAKPSSSPTSSVSISPSLSTSPSSASTPSATPSGSLAVSPSNTARPSSTPSTSAAASSTPSSTARPSSNTARPSSTPSVTPSSSAAASSTPSSSVSPSSTPAVSPSNTARPSSSPSSTARPSVTPSTSAAASSTPSSTARPSSTASSTARPSSTPSSSVSPSSTPAVSPSNTARPSSTPSVTPSTSSAPSSTPSSSVSPSSTPAVSPSNTARPSSTPSVTPSTSAAASSTPSTSAAPSSTPSSSVSPSSTPAVSPSNTASPSCTTSPSASISSSISPPPSPTTNILQYNVIVPSWSGWGCSLAFWANVAGNSSFEELYTDLIFTNKTKLRVLSWEPLLPALWLNIVRFDVGGGNGLNETYPGQPFLENTSPNMPPARRIQGYWRYNESRDPNSDSWDWSRNSNQLSVLKTAQSKGVNIVDLISYGAPYWMQFNHTSQGGTILPDSEGDYAYYIAQVVRHAYLYWNVTFSGIEVFNEPSAGWWIAPSTHDCANVNPDQQVRIVRALRTELDQARAPGAPRALIGSSDENNVYTAISTYNYFKSAGVDTLVDRMYVHGYLGLQPFLDNSARQKLRQLVGDNKPIWITEFGDNDGSGMTLARQILQDILHLQVDAWIYWQPIEPWTYWGFVDANYPTDLATFETDPTRGQPYSAARYKHCIFAQFTRFIRPGSVILSSSDNSTVTAWSQADRTLTIVSAFFDAPAVVTYDLSLLAGTPASSAMAATTASVTYTNTKNASELFVNMVLDISDHTFELDASSYSVYSIVVQG